MSALFVAELDSRKDPNYLWLRRRYALSFDVRRKRKKKKGDICLSLNATEKKRMKRVHPAPPYF